MSDAFDPGTEPPPDAGPGGPPGGDPGGGPGGPPPGGGPILASIARQQMGPQTSAPGPGDMAKGIALVTQAHGLLAQAVPLFPGQQSDDILKAMQRLSRHMSQSAPTAGLQQTQMQDQMRNIVKNALLQNIMRRQGQGGGPGGPGGGGDMAGGAPPPSAPLPGA